MSFSTGIKEEIVKIRVKDAKQRLSLLSALTLTCGSLRLGKNPQLIYLSESQAVARLICSIAGSLYKLESVIELKEQEHRRLPLYAVRLGGEDIKKLLLDSGALGESGEGYHLAMSIPKRLIATEDRRKAFLRGCFLGSGSCNDPKRSYNLEIICKNETFATELCQMIEGFTLQPKLARRKGKSVLYVKDGDSVTGFLALIGSNVGAMDVENARAEKDVINYVNRRSNCDNANINKSAVASARQLQAILKIMGSSDVSKLPRPLLQAAQLRLSHPEATLGELAQMAGIQKSGMNHRLERLMKLAKELS